MDLATVDKLLTTTRTVRKRLDRTRLVEMASPPSRRVGITQRFLAEAGAADRVQVVSANTVRGSQWLV